MLTSAIFRAAIRAAFIVGLFASPAASGAQSNAGPDKVVYHISDTAQASTALVYIENHLEANPQAKIVVVTHAAGVDFLLDGAKNRTGNPYNIPIESLAARGVKFEVCEITLRERKIPKKRFIPEATYVPSGVAEIGRLQQREGYAYLRP